MARLTNGLIILSVLVCSRSFAVDFKVVGEARFEYLFWDVYQAQLATPSGTYQFGNHPTKLTLTYLRDFAAKDIIKATNEQWQHLGKKEIINKYDAQLSALWPDIKKGESLSFITDENGVGTFYFNDKKLGVIEHRGFGDDFLAIWLDVNTSEPQMRKQLIGQ
nr:chalcone isomerase family protein [Pseudoalteromonas ostreae]